MGPKQSNAQSEDNSVEFIINHPKFKKITFLNNNQLMRIELPIPNIKQFREWEQQYSALDFYDDQYLLLARTCSCTKKSICGDSASVQIDYENYSCLLSEELEHRKQSYGYLDQAELWYLFYGLITASCSFQKINSKIGDIRPRNIFLNDVGQVKIANVCSWPSEKTNYQKTLIDEELTYLSPEEINQLKKSNLKIDCDQYLAEAFSIGVTMLESAILQDCSCLYKINFKDNKLSEFQDKLLFQKLMKLWNLGQNQHHTISKFKSSEEPDSLANNSDAKYSWDLKFAISSLCQLNPKNRTTTQELYKWLRPHETQILNVQAFTFQPNTLPPLSNIKKYETIKMKVQNGQLIEQVPQQQKLHKLQGKANSSHHNTSRIKANNQNNQTFLGNQSYLSNQRFIEPIQHNPGNYHINTQPIPYKSKQIVNISYRTEHNNDFVHTTPKIQNSWQHKGPYQMNQGYTYSNMQYTPGSISFSDMSSIKPQLRPIQDEMSLHNEINFLRKINNQVERSRSQFKNQQK